MMTKIGSIASLLALASMSVPASAGVRDAAFASSGDQARPTTSLFVGGDYRVPLDGRGREPGGRARLKLAGAAQLPGSSRLQLSDGVAFGLGASGKATLAIAGMDSRQLGRRMNLSDGATAGLVIGGLVIVGLAVAMASADSDAAAAFWDEDD